MLAETLAAGTGKPSESPPLITDEPGILAVLLAVLALIFWFGQRPAGARFFRIIPSLVFCYFIPTTLTTLGVIPDSSLLYSWIKDFVLPASLLLLVLSLDVPGIIRLGPKAVIMLLAGTTGVVIGGPLALWAGLHILPEGWALPDDAWRGLAALSGSWIGGGANFVAIGSIAETSDSLMGTMVIPDVFVANIWMGVLLYLSGHQKRIDAATGADASAIEELKVRLTDFQARVNRIASVPDLMMIVALGFVASWVSYKSGNWIAEWIDAHVVSSPESPLRIVSEALGPSAWKFIIVTALGVGLSFTRARNLEGAGASKIGSVMIYLLVACIGAGADFRNIAEEPGFLAVGFMWMACHIVILLTVARLIRAPVFFVAVGSQANIGGAASAPVVASAFHPSLAPVGALLAVAGYVLGTYAGLLCMYMLKWVAGA